jgi:hypothetical protein
MSSRSTIKPFHFQVMADMTIEDAAKEDWDLVVLPGGMPGRYRFNLGNNKEIWNYKGRNWGFSLFCR